MGQGSYDADVAAEIGGIAMDFDSAQLVEERDSARNYRADLYDKAKAAKVGSSAQCPSCSKVFVKKSYQQAFCCNKGRGNCKDFYWNRDSDDRVFRTARFHP